MMNSQAIAAPTELVLRDTRAVYLQKPRQAGFFLRGIILCPGREELLFRLDCWLIPLHALWGDW